MDITYAVHICKNSRLVLWFHFYLHFYFRSERNAIYSRRKSLNTNIFYLKFCQLLQLFVKYLTHFKRCIRQNWSPMFMSFVFAFVLKYAELHRQLIQNKPNEQCNYSESSTLFSFKWEGEGAGKRYGVKMPFQTVISYWKSWNCVLLVCSKNDMALLLPAFLRYRALVFQKKALV